MRHTGKSAAVIVLDRDLDTVTKSRPGFGDELIPSQLVNILQTCDPPALMGRKNHE